MAAPVDAYIWPRWDVRNASYQWTASGSGTAEYYLEVSGGGAVPNLTDPPMVEGNALDFTQGTVGSLSASQFDWGDNDTLGFSTIYVRLADDAPPDSKATGFVKAGGDDTGSVGGSESVAFETVQYALNNVTRDTGDGNQFNIKEGAEDNLGGTALVFTTFGSTFTIAAPLIARGYTATKADGGKGEINGGGGSVISDTAMDFLYVVDMHCHNSGSADLFNLDNDCRFINCELNDCDDVVLDFSAGARAVIENCYIHDFGGIAIRGRTARLIANNWLESAQDGASGIFHDNGVGCVYNNVIVLKGATPTGYGISGGVQGDYRHNTIFCENGSTNDGINAENATASTQTNIVGNVISGFSVGVDFNNAALSIDIYRDNLIYDCTTKENVIGDYIIVNENNTIPGSDPFEDSASDDFTLKTAFQGGAYPATFPNGSQTSFRDQGAVHHEDPAGGGATQTSYGYFG